MEEKEELYSSHIFMFPFRFDYNKHGFKHEFEFYRKNNINNRLNLEILNEMLINNQWIYEEFDIEASDEKHILYSEFAYFYDYARESIYNRHNFSPQSIANFYRKPILEGGTYTIEICKTKYREQKEYQLNISGISLRIFSTGVGILSIELDNYQYKEFQEILDINEFGRRVYPGFVGVQGVQNVKDAFLADKITIKDNTDEILVEEDFNNCTLGDIYVGKHIMALLGEDTFSQQKIKGDDKYYIQPSLDDRMFVLSWYGNDEMVTEFQNDKTIYTSNSNWYKYVFVDAGLLTVQNEKMKEKLLCNATYDRWSAFGTFTGISRYSFVVLTSSESSLEDDNAEFIIGHTKSMYFQMMTILLAIRTSILRFSDELAPVATPEHIGKLKLLYEKYLSFYNRLYFKEITHQDQGIELYDIALKQMKIPEHMEKLDGKFTKLHDFANLQAEKRGAERMNLFTKIVSVLAFPSLVIAFLEMDSIKGIEIVQNYGSIFTILSGVFGFYIADYFTKEEDNE